MDRAPIGNFHESRPRCFRHGAEPTEPPHLMAMLKPYPAEAMEAYPVSSRVGNAKNTDAALIEPVAG